MEKATKLEVPVKELLICLGVLALMFLAYCIQVWPYLVGARAALRRSYLYANMHMVETAAEAYKKKHGDYPQTVAQMQEFFPGGVGLSKSENAQGKYEKSISKGNPPINPYTYKDAWPSSASGSNADEMATRLNTNLVPGHITYVHLASPNSFAVAGIDLDDTLEVRTTVLESKPEHP